MRIFRAYPRNIGLWRHLMSRSALWVFRCRKTWSPHIAVMVRAFGESLTAREWHKQHTTARFGRRK